MITADTNIFVYSVDDREREKQPTAELVVTRLSRIGALIGLQVVGEFQNVAFRRLGISAEARALFGHQMLSTFAIFLPSRSAAARAIDALKRNELSYWDALLLASAAEAGCSTLLSEDMKHQETYFGVRVINPFATHGGLSPVAAEALGL